MFTDDYFVSPTKKKKQTKKNRALTAHVPKHLSYYHDLLNTKLMFLRKTQPAAVSVGSRCDVQLDVIASLSVRVRRKP